MGCAEVPAGRAAPIFIRAGRGLLAGLIGLGLLSCGGDAERLPDQPALTSDGPGAVTLPAPSLLRQAGYIPAELLRRGADYLDTGGYPLLNAAGDGECCAFSPNWTPASHPPDGLAYACYSFGMTDYDRAHAISFLWDDAGDPADLWVALADWGRNRWAWYQPDAAGLLETDLTPHIEPEIHSLLVLPVLTGTADWRLHRIAVGDLCGLSGRVWLDDGETPLYDAEVLATGPGAYSARTDFEGRWLISGALPGDYSVSTSLIGYEFTPPSRDVLVDQLDAEVDDFWGTPLPTHTVSGSVLAEPGAEPVGGVELAVNPQDGSGGGILAWTDFDGNWTVQLPDGDFVVVPDKPGWSFAPAQRLFSVSGVDLIVDDFTATQLPGYLLDGYVYLDDGVTPVEGTQITVTHDELDLTFYDSTDESGYWSVSGAPDGDYTVVPMWPGWTFEPAERHPTVAGADVRVEPFLATELGRFNIDGYVYLDDGVTPLSGAGLQLSCDTGWFSATTDSSGRYLFSGIYAGQCTVTPVDIRYSFEPPFREFQLAADTTLDPFLGTEVPSYNVDGYIYRSDGITPVADVLVTVYTYIPAGTIFEGTTDASGHWLIPGIPSGFYNVYPYKPGYNFEPVECSIQVEDADLRVDDFLGTSLPAYTMDGYIYELDGVTGVPGVPVSVSGWLYNFEAVTDEEGHWQLDEVFNDLYMVMPMLPPWKFTPQSHDVEVDGADVHVPSFFGELLEAYAVDGYIFEADSTTPVPDVDVWFHAISISYRIVTDASGYYSLPLPVGDWEVWPSSSCWDFDPVFQNVTVDDAPQMLEVFYATPGG